MIKKTRHSDYMWEVTISAAGSSEWQSSRLRMWATTEEWYRRKILHQDGTDCGESRAHLWLLSCTVLDVRRERLIGRGVGIRCFQSERAKNVSGWRFLWASRNVDTLWATDFCEADNGKHSQC